MGRGAKVSAGEPARSPGIRKRPGGTGDQDVLGIADRGKIVGESLAQLLRGLFALLGAWIAIGEAGEKRFGVRIALGSARPLDGFARPFVEIEIEQRQVEQPFARIIDDIDVQPVVAKLTLPEALGFILDGDAHLAEAPGALRPGAFLAGQGGDVALIVEAGDGIVGLGFEVDPADTGFRGGVKKRQPAFGH